MRAKIWHSLGLVLLLLTGTIARADDPPADDPEVRAKGDKAAGRRRLSEWLTRATAKKENERSEAIRTLYYVMSKRGFAEQGLPPAVWHKTTDALLEVLRSDATPHNRTTAAQALLYAPNPIDVKIIRVALANLEHKDLSVVHFSFALLEQRPDLPEVVTLAIRLLDSADDTLRGHAAELVWLAGKGAASALPKLQKLMREDRLGTVRARLALAVYGLTGDTDGPVLSLWHWLDDTPEGRGFPDNFFGPRAVAYTLGEIGPKARPVARPLAQRYEINRNLLKDHPDWKDTLGPENEAIFDALVKIDHARAVGVLPDAPPPPAGFPKFKVQEIDTGLKIGYAVILEDLNGDKKPDIIVVDQHKIVWYENPTWKKRVILDGQTKPDNVCICALDIDGDGDLELVVGAAWKPFDTKNPGTLQWLKRGKTLDDPWEMHPIPCDEPTVHRVRAIDLHGDGKKEIVLAPLMGRDATAAANWADGRPVRLLAYKVPATQHKPESWKPTVLSEDLHVVHNFAPYTLPGAKKPMSLITASYEGYSAVILGEGGKKNQTNTVHEGNQDNPKSNRGASEIKAGLLKDGAVVATIEPWHGNQVVAYTGKRGEKPTRRVLDDHLRWGHAVSFADLDGDGADDLVIGVRDNPAKDDKFTEKRGVRLYRNAGDKWDRYILDDGGVAVEDLAVGDLNGDGRPDIVAVGRATGNCRIYWNQGKK